MKIEFNYHKGIKTVVIPDTAAVTVLEPRPVSGVASIGQALDHALENPVAGPSLAQILRAATDRPRIAIAVPDDTRPLPVGKILPRLLTTGPSRKRRSLPVPYPAVRSCSTMPGTTK